ncbi:MAG: histone [Candidatus Nanohaloarchaea archaeon]
MEFSTSKMKDLIKSETDKRVAEDAANRLREVLERYAGDIAEQAIDAASKDDRKTVRGEDVKEVLS